jgi:hypothetical protein
MTSRCPQDSVWNVGSYTLEGAGLVENATECELATDGIRTIPELHGAARYTVEMPLVLPPMDIPVIGAHELPNVKKALTSGIRFRAHQEQRAGIPKDHGSRHATPRVEQAANADNHFALVRDHSRRYRHYAGDCSSVFGSKKNAEMFR